MPYLWMFCLCLVSGVLAAQPYSPRDPLRTSEVTLRVVGFDSLIDPKEMTIIQPNWLGESQMETVALDSAGRAKLQLRSSVIRQYGVMYGRNMQFWLQRPGEEVLVDLGRTANGYSLRAPQNPFVEESLALIDRFFRLILQPGLPETDLGDFMQASARRETAAGETLDSLRAGGYLNDPALIRWAEQFITYELKRNVQVFPLIVEYQPGSAQDSLLALARYPAFPMRLEEQEVYTDSYLDYVAFQTVGYRARSRPYTASLPEKDRFFGDFTWRDSTIRTILHPFTRDFLLAKNLNQFLNAAQRDPRVTAAAEVFVTQTPFPLLREPIARQLLVLSESLASGKYEPNILELPEGVENPVPEILRRHAGKVVVLDFWATWCGPCRQEFDSVYPELVQKYAGAPVAFVFLSVDDEEKIWKAYLSRLAFEGTHLLLNHSQRTIVSRLFTITGYPHRAVFDREGHLAEQTVPLEKGALERVIERLSRE